MGASKAAYWLQTPCKEAGSAAHRGQQFDARGGTAWCVLRVDLAKVRPATAHLLASQPPGARLAAMTVRGRPALGGVHLHVRHKVSKEFEYLLFDDSVIFMVASGYSVVSRYGLWLIPVACGSTTVAGRAKRDCKRRDHFRRCEARLLKVVQRAGEAEGGAVEPAPAQVEGEQEARAGHQLAAPRRQAAAAQRQHVLRVHGTDKVEVRFGFRSGSRLGLGFRLGLGVMATSVYRGNIRQPHEQSDEISDSMTGEHAAHFGNSWKSAACSDHPA